MADVPIGGYVSTITQVGALPQAGAQQQAAGGLASLSSQDFLDLLVAQISNQNPLSPVSSSQFMSQTAELSTLEQITSLSQETSQVLAESQLQTAVSAIGRTVTGASSTGKSVSGTVKGVQDSPSGPLLEVGSTEIPLANVTAFG
jgi:flagellar basal-body rod modification protein FlgD